MRDQPISYAGFLDDDMGPLPTEWEQHEILSLIVAEFKSDPMSVQCFDQRIVDRSIASVDAFEQRYRSFFRRHGRDPRKW